MLKWTMIVLISLASLAGFSALVGSMLPKGHRASRTTTLAAAPAVVFGVITDFARAPEWRRALKQVEIVPDDGRGRIVREHGKQGVVPYRVEALEPPARLVMRIADPSLVYGGACNVPASSWRRRHRDHDHRGWASLQSDLPRHAEALLLAGRDDRRCTSTTCARALAP